ncbi:alpha/beta fold hydrolase [Pontibacter qinzhouensis]|uniref:Alpha/beta fold hydrolase n=1 Tax=Pontibacter qinzhouensis TaxID=2603253 RepID=A0A5C8KB27_9BACT|nr:alpha/beta fold hydrolase [Pontibacter qinzhouensis]TXK46452.1 alpha/beta fold hydrolase [Pontibacter qinzhouensis]
MIKILAAYILFLSSFLSFTSCKTATDEPIPVVTDAQPASYVSSSLLLSVPLSTLQAILPNQPYAAYHNEVKFGVSVYKLIYKTTYQGKEINASGLICVPDGLSTLAPVLSVQHGTIFAHNEAPSHFSGVSGFELFASAGYITLIPDYLGFGESKQVLHPYYDRQHSAMAVVDMLKAAKEFYKEQHIATSDKLYLVGYSEGGYVTLAAQQEIETNAAHGLTITAVAAGAGGYDLTSMLQDVTSGQDYSYPAYLAYILHAYNQTNNWQRPLSDMFQEPYAAKLPALFNGSNSGSIINRELPRNPQKLLTPAFYQGLLQSNGEQTLKKALQDNSLTNWTPQSPTRLYHGTADDIVPFQNSQTTFDGFKANGAKNIEFFPIQGGTHGSSLAPMLESVIPWIKAN